MTKIFESQTILMGKPVYCLAIKLDEGINVQLSGGDKSHIGAVSITEGDDKINTHTVPGHKETTISEKWAKEIYGKTKETVVVSVGIHYDNISKENINAVLIYTDDLLKNLLEKLEKQ